MHSSMELLDQDFKEIVMNEAPAPGFVESDTIKNTSESNVPTRKDVAAAQPGDVARRIMTGSTSADRYRKAVVGQLLADYRTFFQFASHVMHHSLR